MYIKIKKIKMNFAEIKYTYKLYIYIYKIIFQNVSFLPAVFIKGRNTHSFGASFYPKVPNTI